MEEGYLQFEADTELLVLSPPYPGHAGNFYNNYVYAQNILSSKCGWAPTLLLHELGCGAIGILQHIRSRSQFNNEVVKLVGKQNNRFVVLSNIVEKIAVKENNLVIFDDLTAITDFINSGKEKLNSDEGGDEGVFTLFQALLLGKESLPAVLV